jgi:hypothetical protein
MTQNIGPTSLVSYISFTLLFFIVKNQFPFPGTSWIWAFLIITGLIQFLNNLYITKLPEVCGAYNVHSALIGTIVPWITIFGVTCFCLIFIPGWLRVFSNTFGSAIANMAGMKETVAALFPPKAPPTNANPALQESTAVLYTNIGTFINEIDINDYREDEEGKAIGWNSLESVMTFLGTLNVPNKLELMKQLHKMLKLKEDAGYFMWFILIGSISVLISTNSVLLSSCSGLEFSL